MTFLNPDEADQDPAYGWRFIRAGWIKELYLKGETTSIFRPHTVFPAHPTFGYTHEMVPALDLKQYDDATHAKRLNIGVGVIKQDLKRRFKAEPLILFPWETKVTKVANKTILSSEQISGDHHGYAYKLVIKTIITDESPVIEYQQTLENTGTRDIPVSAYVHPFFNAVNGFDHCWYILPKLTQTIVDGQPFANLLPFPASKTPGLIERLQADIPPRGNWVAAGNFFGQNNSVRISSDQPLIKMLFWRSKTDCFAVEPFVKVHVSPGNSQSWKWFLVVSKNALNQK
ncbi:hypothetical protein JYU15_00565 [bacterium AH-315-I18]|nr:hypothetical protein [bacterium AH-315-I18]